MPPQEHDFDTDDLSEIADHFVLSSSGFDSPNRYSDLKLPMVNPDGKLNGHAVKTANSGAHSVEAVGDIEEETKAEAKDVLESLVDEFDDLDLSD
ncbi:hypothetical protein SAMN05421858_2582 [Haladaptatus litoreus]|uniref:Uncharacterized protein n=1 Tax=Haladaptatus litoreus TaxID=553468 RepID=A0A1N7BJB3_9EURY|nr:hypothetical protein [Haladaptatus litoreus]SIR51293.1 hypothetical protein SAMN05421858_2582 [Haladaptatus litoreus]